MTFKLPQLEGFYAYFTAFIFGALSVLAFAPCNIFPLIILAMAVLVWLWHERSCKHTLLTGWWYGFGLYSAGASWVYVSIHEFGHTPVPLALVMTVAFTAGLALFFVIHAALYHFLKLHRYYLLAFPALWVLSEWLRTWLLTGFPWLYSGYAFIDTPLAGFAPVSGVMGLSFVTSLIACIVFALFRQTENETESETKKISHHKLHKAGLCGIAIILVLTGWTLKQIEWTRLSEQPPLAVSLIQGNIPQDKKWETEMKDYTLNLYPELSAPAWGKELVIWPEAAVPAFQHEVQAYLNELGTIARVKNSTLITGIPVVETTFSESQTSSAYYNSIIALGEGSGVYHKQKLVPFGEYVPLEKWLRGLMPFFNLPMSGFNRGSSHQAPLLAGDVQIAPFVCYEIVYPDLVVSSARNVDILLTLSNDAWFGESIGPLQHFQMARMRALESGKYLLRGTNNGLTGIIGHKGQIIATAPQFKTTVLNGEVRLTEGITPFSRFGSTPVILLALLIVIASSLITKIRN